MIFYNKNCHFKSNKYIFITAMSSICKSVAVLLSIFIVQGGSLDPSCNSDGECVGKTSYSCWNGMAGKVNCDLPPSQHISCQLPAVGMELLFQNGDYDCVDHGSGLYCPGTIWERFVNTDLTVVGQGPKNFLTKENWKYATEDGLRTNYVHFKVELVTEYDQITDSCSTWAPIRHIYPVYATWDIDPNTYTSLMMFLGILSLLVFGCACCIGDVGAHSSSSNDTLLWFIICRSACNDTRNTTWNTD